MSNEWIPDAVGCESDTDFDYLPEEVRKHVSAAREWDMVEDMLSHRAVVFVDRPLGRMFGVWRVVDEIGMESITVYEIRYTERLNPGW